MSLRAHLLAGQVIPAHPLALAPDRTLDERRQRALTRYYVAAGAGGMAVGVHTTQFEIREHGLLRPVLELAMETADAALSRDRRPFARIAGVVGPTRAAVGEAEIAAAIGYDAALVSLGGLGGLSDAALVAHCRAVADVLPIVGFYLQPAVGGRPLGAAFWRELAEVPGLVAVKIAPFASVSAAARCSHAASAVGASPIAFTASSISTARRVHTAHCPSRPPTMRRVVARPPVSTGNGVSRSCTMLSSLPV